MSDADSNQSGGEINAAENPYRSPISRHGEPRFAPRRLFRVARLVLLASWAVTLVTIVYGMFHAADGDPQQWGTAIFSVLSLFVSVLLSVAYALGGLFLFALRSFGKHSGDSEPQTAADCDPRRGPL